MSNENLFRIEWGSEVGPGYNFGFKIDGKRIDFIREDGYCSLQVDDEKVYTVSASQLEETIRKVKLGNATTGFLRDDFLANLLESHGLKVDQDYGGEDNIEGDLQLDTNCENDPYSKQMKFLFSQIYKRNPERFKELAFLHSLDFRTTASSERVRKISEFARQNSLDVVTAQASASNGLSTSSSDVEISVFDFKGYTPKILDSFETYCSNNGLESCSSSRYYGAPDMEDSNLIADAFRYACYGDWMQLRRYILQHCTKEQFSEAMNRFVKCNTITKHLQRFNLVFEQKEDGKLLLPKGLEFPPTGEYIHSILPTLKESRRIYLKNHNHMYKNNKLKPNQ